MPDVREIIEQLRAARAARDEAHDRSHAALIEGTSLRRKAARDLRARAGADHAGAEEGAAIERNAAAIAALGREESAAAGAVAGSSTTSIAIRHPKR